MTKHKKIPNNTIIEIDNCFPLETLKLQKNVMRITKGERILFASGKGMHRLEIQQLYDELENAETALLNIRNVLRSWGKTVTAIPRQIWKRHSCG